MPLEHEALTYDIIGAAISVHKEMGPGFLEVIYQNAMCLELASRGINFETELDVPIRYQGKQVGLHRLDLFIERQIVVELKSIKPLEDTHFAIVKSYLRAASVDHGLLLNFSSATLQIRRVSAKLGATSFPGYVAS